MLNVEEIHKKIEKAGLEFLGISYNEPGEYLVWCFDKKAAGIKPIKECCRDAIDYDLRYKAWRKEGTLIFQTYLLYD